MRVREPIYLITLVILALAGTEGLVSWHALLSHRYEARIATLERALADKTAEVNRLIFVRDSENRRHAADAASAAAASDDGEVAEAMLHEAVAEPIAAARPVHAPAPAEPPAQDAAAERSYPKLPNPLMDAALAEDAAETRDSLSAPQGSAPIGPEDIDLKRLVNMANIMTGRKIAELTRFDGKTVIHYRGTAPREDDPIWHVLDAVKEARALREVLLVGKSDSDLPRRKRLMQSMVQFGLPSDMIRLQSGSMYEGLEGILIGVRKDKS